MTTKPNGEPMTDPAADFAEWIGARTGQDDQPPAPPETGATAPTGPRPDPSQGPSGIAPPRTDPLGQLAQLVQDTDRGDGRGNWQDIREAAIRQRGF